jgi:hypothetical protein
MTNTDSIDRPVPEGDHTQVLSRRRTLSALVEVRMKVEGLRDKARHSLYWCNQYNLESGKVIHAAKERALDEVLGYFAEVEREEPKGYTDYPDKVSG